MVEECWKVDVHFGKWQHIQLLYNSASQTDSGVQTLRKTFRFFFKRSVITLPYQWEQKQVQKMKCILQMSYFSFSVENWTDKRHTDHASQSNGASPWRTQLLTNKKHWVFPGKLQTLVSVHFTVVLKNMQYLKDWIFSTHRKLTSRFTNCEHRLRLTISILFPTSIFTMSWRVV